MLHKEFCKFFEKKNLITVWKILLAKKLQPAQITDKTYVFFQYYGDSDFESRFALQDRSLEYIKNNRRFHFPFFDN